MYTYDTNEADVPVHLVNSDHFFCVHCSSKYAQEFYDEMFEEPDTESTIISLRTIEEFTKLFTNFAKHG